MCSLALQGFRNLVKIVNFSCVLSKRSFQTSLAIFTAYVLTAPNHYLSPQVAFVSLNIINMLDWAMQFLPILQALAAQVIFTL